MSRVATNQLVILQHILPGVFNTRLCIRVHVMLRNASLSYYNRLQKGGGGEGGGGEQEGQLCLQNSRCGGITLEIIQVNYLYVKSV